MIMTYQIYVLKLCLCSCTLKVQCLNTANKQKSHGTPAPPNEFIAVLKLTVPGRRNISSAQGFPTFLRTVQRRDLATKVWLKTWRSSVLFQVAWHQSASIHTMQKGQGVLPPAHALSHCIGNFNRPHLEAGRILKKCLYLQESRIESMIWVGNPLINLNTSFSSMTWLNSAPNITQKTCPEPSGCPCSAHGGMKTLSSLCQLLNPKKRDTKNPGAF